VFDDLGELGALGDDELTVLLGDAVGFGVAGGGELELHS
jgi:hypothetical protein